MKRINKQPKHDRLKSTTDHYASFENFLLSVVINSNIDNKDIKSNESFFRKCYEDDKTPDQAIRLYQIIYN